MTPNFRSRKSMLKLANH